MRDVFSSDLQQCKGVKNRKMDPTQEALLNEKCFLVDENDRVIGETTKRDCHQVHAGEHIKLHRAFSVFLFNSKGEFLVQKRAAGKVTYPLT